MKATFCLVGGLLCFAGCAYDPVPTPRRADSAASCPHDSVSRSKTRDTPRPDDGNKSFRQGYKEGQADAVKRFYWEQEKQQLQPTNPPGVELYPVLIPEHTVDGVVVQPTVRVITIAR